MKTLVFTLRKTQSSAVPDHHKPFIFHCKLEKKIFSKNLKKNNFKNFFIFTLKKTMANTDNEFITLSGGRVIYFRQDGRYTIWNGTNTEAEVHVFDAGEIGGIKADKDTPNIMLLSKGDLKPYCTIDVASKGNAVSIVRNFFRLKAKTMNGADNLFAKKSRPGGFRGKKKVQHSDDDDEEEEPVKKEVSKPKTAVAPRSKKTAPAKKSKKAPVQEESSDEEDEELIEGSDLEGSDLDDSDLDDSDLD